MHRSHAGARLNGKQFIYTATVGTLIREGAGDLEDKQYTAHAFPMSPGRDIGTPEVTLQPTQQAVSPVAAAVGAQAP